MTGKNNNSMKKICILGKGYIGAFLEKKLIEGKLDVMCLKRSDLDYTSPYHLRSFLQAHKDEIECVINCSGYTGFPNVDGCETNKQDCWFWNVKTPSNIAAACNLTDISVINVSSGCIYTGYDKIYSETDVPNFGMYSDSSSFYSKSKHACEINLDGWNVYTLRIRMPFDGTNMHKNYINKIYNYKKLINMPNSVTSVDDLTNFILKFLFIYKHLPVGPYNIVNEGAVSATDIIELFKAHNIADQGWEFVDMSELDIVAGRSNCILSTEKIRSFSLGLPSAKESLELEISKYAKLL